MSFTTKSVLNSNKTTYINKCRFVPWPFTKTRESISKVNKEASMSRTSMVYLPSSGFIGLRLRALPK